MRRAIYEDDVIKLLDKGWKSGVYPVASNIHALPSAQPKIIRCKDCKHYKAVDYTDKLACHYVIGCKVIRNLDDFCSRAERWEE